MAPSMADGAVLSGAVLQAEWRISGQDAACRGRCLGPLAKNAGLVGM